MGGYERAVRTLRREVTDCVATWGGWVANFAFFEYITGKCFWEAPQSVAIEAWRKLEVDMVSQNTILPASPDDWRTLEGPEVHAVRRRIKSAEDVIAYVETLPDPGQLEREFDFDGTLDSVRSYYLRYQDELGSDIFCLPWGSSAKFIWYLDFGFEAYLTALALYPGTARKLFEYSGEAARLENLVRAELVKGRVLPGIFFVGHDICGNSGPMVSPEALRSLYFPNLLRSLEPLVEIDAEIIWRSDGYIIPILDDLIACGVSGFQGFQEETGFDIGEIARCRVRGGKHKPLLLAGLSNAGVLTHGTVADVQKEVERIVAAAGAGAAW